MGCFSLGSVLLFSSLPHFPLFLNFFFTLSFFPPFSATVHAKPLGEGCLDHVELAPSLTSKFLPDFLLLSFQLLLLFPALETKPLPKEHEPFKGSRWLTRRKVVGRRMQMILDVFAIFISSRPCCWGKYIIQLGLLRILPLDHAGSGGFNDYFKLLQHFQCLGLDRITCQQNIKAL